MNITRIILILLGITLLGGIVWWERRRRAHLNPHEQAILENIAGEIRAEENGGAVDFSGLDGITATDGAFADTYHAENTLSSSRPPSAHHVTEEKLVVINLVAPEEHPYSGHNLLVALQDAHLVLGEMNIFHHYVKGYRRPVFSMANMVEPGTFNSSTMHDFLTPGLTFFMRLPGQVKGPQALELMLKSALHLATELGGNLCDQSRHPLDKVALNKLHEEVIIHQQRLDDATKYYSLHNAHLK